MVNSFLLPIPGRHLVPHSLSRHKYQSLLSFGSIYIWLILFVIVRSPSQKDDVAIWEAGDTLPSHTDYFAFRRRLPRIHIRRQNSLVLLRRNTTNQNQTIPSVSRFPGYIRLPELIELVPGKAKNL